MNETCMLLDGRVAGRATPVEIAGRLYDLFEKLTRCSDTRQRELICTPCGGNYGSVAYWVIAVNGSPPRGTILFGSHYDLPPDIFFIDQCRSRRLGQSQCGVVKDFVNCFLREQVSDHYRRDRPATIQVTADGTSKEVSPLALDNKETA